MNNMNPHVEEKFIAEIRTAFGITTEPEIRYDHSGHYKTASGEKDSDAVSKNDSDSNN